MNVINLIEAVESGSTAKMYDAFTKLMQEKTASSLDSFRQSILEQALGIVIVNEELESLVEELQEHKDFLIQFSLSEQYASLSEVEQKLFQEAFEEIV